MDNFIKPFIWMFDIANFKQHIKYLISIWLKFFVPSVLFLFISFFCQNGDVKLFITVCVIYIILFVSAYSCVLGYFWELVFKVITREFDYSCASIYDGNINEVFKIELPELNTKRFIWRGIASCFAILLMFLPITLITLLPVVLSLKSGMSTSVAESYYIGSLLAWLIFLFLMPALLWNYARRNSVVATLNIPKAVFISGNYTLKYLLNGFLFFVFNLTIGIFLNTLAFILNIGAFDFTNPVYAFEFMFYSIVVFALYLYGFYVNAYLLGTISPAGEN